MKRTLYIALVTVVSVYLVVAILLAAFQRNFIYFPTKPVAHGREELAFSNGPQVLKIIVLNKGQQNGLIYFGGNAEAVGRNASGFERTLKNHTVYLVNYRGYGGSTGSPEEKAFYSDALAIYDKVSALHQSISVMGRSLGTGVATSLASEREIDKLVLVSPYDSIQNVAQNVFPMFPMGLLLLDKFDSASRAENIQSDTLILMAEHDDVIERARTENLVTSFINNQLDVLVIEGTNHNNISQHSHYYKIVYTFLSATSS